MSQLLTPDELRVRMLADLTAAVTLRADGASFQVWIDMVDGIFMLADAGGHVQRFVDPRDALSLLRGTGIEQVRVEYASWTPEAAEAERTYESWLQHKVGASLAGLRDGSNPTYSKEEWEKIKAERMSRLAAS